MKKLLKTHDPKTVQLSEQDALVPCSMKEGKEQLNIKDELIVILTAMLVSLSWEVMSRDIWEMAKQNAVRIAEKYGIREEEFHRLSKIAFQKFEIIRRSNPISGMF